MLDYGELANRRGTLVAKVCTSELTQGPRQFSGLPAELTNGIDRRLPMPSATWLFIREFPHSNSGAVELFRFANDGKPAGDSWHSNYAEAFEQAFDEFGIPHDAWKVIPESKWGDLHYAKLMTTST